MRLNHIFRVFFPALALVVVTCAAALADECALCGQETHSDSYLCTDCMVGFLNQKAPEDPLEIIAATPNEDGSVTLSWTDNSGAPYQVFYELLENAPRRFGWTAEAGTTATTCTLDYLVPGASYVLTVRDCKGIEASYTYFASAPESSERIGAKIDAHPVLGGMVTTALSAAEIEREGGPSHELYVQLTYSMLKYTRNYSFLLAVEAPNGLTDAVLWGDCSLRGGRSTVYPWKNIPMDDYFSLLKTYYGSVPAGDYTVTLYFNGKVSCSSTFTVGE